MVDGGGPSRASAERRGQRVESVSRFRMGEMGALAIVFGVGEVEGVGVTSAAHRHVDPLPVGSTVDDGEGVAGGNALSFVAGEGVSIVDVVLVEIPAGQVPGLGVTIETHGERLVVRVDGDDGSEVAVEHVEPVLVFSTEDAVTGLEDPRPCVEGGSVETLRCGQVAACLLIEFGDGVAVVSDEQPTGGVTGDCDVAIPVADGPSDRVVSVLSDDETAMLSVFRDGPVH